MTPEHLNQELEQFQTAYTLITEFVVQYSFKILGALIIFLIGLWFANKVAKLVSRKMAERNIDITLTSFTGNFVRLLVIIMVAIIALGKLGISITPMVAAIGAASLGAGLAIQGMLSNYAAGLTIIVTKPFVVGNTISVQGVTGLVKDINLGMTQLTNEEGERITIPNKHIIGEVLHNSFENKLVETHFNIDYESDPTQAIAAINAVLSEHASVAKGSACHIGINDFNNFGIELGVRYWVPTQSYFQDKYQVNLAIYGSLKAIGVKLVQARAISSSASE